MAGGPGGCECQGLAPFAQGSTRGPSSVRTAGVKQATPPRCPLVVLGSSTTFHAMPAPSVQMSPTLRPASSRKRSPVPRATVRSATLRRDPWPRTAPRRRRCSSLVSVIGAENPGYMGLPSAGPCSLSLKRSQAIEIDPVTRGPATSVAIPGRLGAFCGTERRAPAGIHNHGYGRPSVHLHGGGGGGPKPVSNLAGCSRHSQRNAPIKSARVTQSRQRNRASRPV